MSPLKKLLSYPTKSTPSSELFGISLDLSYISSNLIVCSFPTSDFPQTLFRNNINDLLNYLHIKHGTNWSIWNLRLEGSDYTPFSNMNYFPWPDHESPPFTLLLKIIGSIHDYLVKDKSNVAVIHCKMGKGRSGLVAVAYMIKYLKVDSFEAESLFTEKRMKAGFGPGISILSQRRYVQYVQMSNIFDYQGSIGFRVDFIKVINPIFQNLKHLKVLLQYYNKDHKLLPGLPTNDCVYIHSEPLDFAILRFPANESVEQDVRLSFELKSNTTDIPFAMCYIWFNLYWESLGPLSGRCSFRWELFDGFKGTSKKGMKLFDSVEIFYSPFDINNSN